MFIVIISLSLPPTWDAFIELYVGGQMDHDPKYRLSSQKRIRLIKEEYIRLEQRNHPSESTIDTAYETNRGTHKSLAMRISKPSVQPKPQNNLYCRHRILTNHTVEHCQNLGRDSCGSCGKYGHARKDCRKNRGNKRKRDEDNEEGKR